MYFKWVLPRKQTYTVVNGMLPALWHLGRGKTIEKATIRGGSELGQRKGNVNIEHMALGGH